jgi:hypothetical protein
VRVTFVPAANSVDYVVDGKKIKFASPLKPKTEVTVEYEAL